MKKVIYFMLISFSLFSCSQPQKTTEQQNTEAYTYHQQAETTYKVIDVVDSIVSLYPNLYVNDVQKKKFCQCLRKEVDKKLKADNSFLQEIPMQFSQMLQKSNGKYILKFECGKYTTKDKKLISAQSETEINYAIFAEVDEDFASTLENNAIYTIKGTYKGYVDGKLTLPSGKVFDFPTDCYKYSSYQNGSVCLGGFLFRDLQVTIKY